MNREQRTPWLTLCCVDLPSPKYFDGSNERRLPWAQWRVSLCHFCKFADLSGGCCSEGELECSCGLETVEENCDNVWNGSDCFAFRPRFIFEDCVDTVGLALQGLFVDWNTLREIPRTKHPKCPALKQEKEKR